MDKNPNTEDLLAALWKIAAWRKECHAYDEDMGHELRDFGPEDLDQIELMARTAIAQAENAHAGAKEGGAPAGAVTAAEVVAILCATLSAHETFDIGPQIEGHEEAAARIIALFNERGAS